MTDAETIALRATVIAGKRYDDDFTVIWRGLPIGRVMLVPDCRLTSRNGDGPATSTASREVAAADQATTLIIASGSSRRHGQRCGGE